MRFTTQASSFAAFALAFSAAVAPAIAFAQYAPAPTLTLVATNTVMTSGASYANAPMLSWWSTDAASCTASGAGWSGSVALAGRQKVIPAQTTVYAMTCAGAGGSVTKSITITVAPRAAQTASALAALEQRSAPTPSSPAAFSHSWHSALFFGSRNRADIYALQTALTLDGVYSGEITGGFYAQTRAAVKRFQAKHGIEATGFVGPLTRAKLNELYGG